MNKKHLKQLLICFSCIFIGFSFTIPYLSYATTQEDLDNAKDNLESMKAEQSRISSELSEIDGQLSTIGNHISELDTQINSKQSEIDSLQEELNSISISMDEQYSSMKLRIKYMYERSDNDIWDVLLTSKSFGEMLIKSEYIQQLTQYDRDMLTEMENLYKRQQAAKEELNSDIAELTALKTAAENEQNSLKELLAKTQQKLNETSDNISEAEQLALAYEKQLEEERIAREKAAAEEASRQAAEEEARRQAAAANGGLGSSVSTPNTPISYDASDLAMLAAIIECEAGNQPYEGKLAVGSVVINRVNSPRFANSISGVLYAPGQFTPVASGRFTIVLARGASASCVQAAQEVLNGNITINALYFHMYRSGIDTYGTIIGDHIFF